MLDYHALIRPELLHISVQWSKGVLGGTQVDKLGSTCVPSCPHCVKAASPVPATQSQLPLLAWKFLFLSAGWSLDTRSPGGQGVLVAAVAYNIMEFLLMTLITV